MLPKGAFSLSKEIKATWQGPSGAPLHHITVLYIYTICRGYIWGDLIMALSEELPEMS